MLLKRVPLCGHKFINKERPTPKLKQLNGYFIDDDDDDDFIYHCKKCKAFI